MISVLEHFVTDLNKSPDRIAGMFDAIAGNYDFLNHLLSAGIDKRWRRLTNAMTTLDRQLQAQPGSQRALINYGAVNARLNKFEEAIPYYDRALKVAPNDEIALFNRGTANSKLNRLEAAQKDFEALLNVAKSNYRAVALFNLGDVHYRKKNRKMSIGYFEDFIKASPEGAPEIAVAKERIRLLESGGTL